MTRREEVIGDCRLILGDCLQVLPTLEPVDAVVTDPPYGIGRDGKPASTSSHGGHKGYAFTGWDQKRPDRATFETILASGRSAIIWGGNYFADCLPPSAMWLVWDKGQRICQADAELAWTSLNRPVRVMTLNRVEIALDGAEHPTQKPLRLMKWCLGHLPADAQTILDPFMGSGTTGVACVNLGRKFIGVELEPKYFDIACRRIEEAYKQPRLFEEPAPKAVQPSMFGGAA